MASASTYVERNASYWQRNLVVCVFGSFTTLVSLTMLLPILPLYVEQLGVHDPAAVLRWSSYAFSATFVGTGLTAPLWGHLADAYGRKIMVVRAAIAMAVVMSLIGMAGTATELVVLRLLAGLFGGFASASIVLIGSQVPKERAGWALGILSTGGLCGNLSGPLVGGFLSQWVGIRGTFFVGGALIAVAALASITLLREDFDRQSGSRHSSDGPPRSREDRSAIWVLLLTASMVLFASMSIEPILTAYVGRLGIEKAKVAQYGGIVMSAAALGSLIAAPRLGALADRIGGWRVILWSLVATGVTLVPQAWVESWWQLSILRFLMGMTLAGLLPAIGKLIRTLAGEGASGRLLGLLQSAQFAGQVAGPLVAGQVGASFGLEPVFYVTSAMMFVSALVVWRRLRFRPRTSGQTADSKQWLS